MVDYSLSPKPGSSVFKHHFNSTLHVHIVYYSCGSSAVRVGGGSISEPRVGDHCFLCRLDIVAGRNMVSEVVGNDGFPNWRSWSRVVGGRGDVTAWALCNDSGVASWRIVRGCDCGDMAGWALCNDCGVMNRRVVVV